MRSKESILKEAIYQETPLKNCIGVVKHFGQIAGVFTFHRDNQVRVC